MNITKRNGSVVLYDTRKTIQSILRANAETVEEQIPENEAGLLAHEAFYTVVAENEVITTQNLRESVISVLRKNGYALTAKKYEDYQKQENPERSKK